MNETLQNTTNEVSACGSLWIRQGVTGIWTEGWAKVHNHHMFYWIQGFDVLFEADLRKSLIIKRDVPKSDWCNRIEHSSSLGPLLLVQHGRLFEKIRCLLIFQKILAQFMCNLNLINAQIYGLNFFRMKLLNLGKPWRVVA